MAEEGNSAASSAIWAIALIIIVALLALVVWKIVDHPGDEIRQGALVAGASAIVLVVSAFAVAAAPVKRARSARFGHPGVFVPPPAPPRWDPNESVGPPP